MAYIWHVNINGEIEFHKDAIALIPDLKNVSDKLLKFVILYEDYRFSPIKDFPERERYLLSKIKAGYEESEDLLSDPNVQKVISEFKGLVYDERRELKRIYQHRLDGLKVEIMKRDLLVKDIKEKKDLIEFFRKEIDAIDKELSMQGFDDDEVDVKGKRKLSYIERWQRRVKKFSEMNYE